MIFLPPLPATRTVLSALVLGWVAAASSAPCAGSKNPMRFASEMAERGNWREAEYRWKLSLDGDPNNPKILNNLAVAAEALGDLEGASELYDRAVSRANGEPRIHDNHRRFVRFLARVRGPDSGSDGGGGGSHSPPVVGSGDGRKMGKVTTVPVGLPVAPRLDLEGFRTVLVASFLTRENALIDTNRELVRYLRSEFRKHTDLEVLDVVPPPAIPEQTIDDLLQNGEFWRELAREYGADLIVSGVVNYDREDASGFRNVDTISQVTGQKIRETRFVEQEKFLYGLHVFFIEGASGDLLARDRVEQGLIFSGAMNDPIAAFYEMSELIAGEVLAVVTPRTREEPRYIFRK